MKSSSSTAAVTRRVLASLLLPFACASSALADDPPPDLVAFTVGGPGQVHVTQSVFVTAVVKNGGGPVIGTYTGEIVLSPDVIVDDTDVVVGTFTTSQVGALQAIATIPPDFAPGPYVWGLRILPADGEVELGNNLTVGMQTNVIKVDLELTDPTPIMSFARPTDAEEQRVQVEVINAGTEKSILVFMVAPLQPAPWLEVSPPSSFAIGGEEGNDIELIFHHDDLPIGTYQTTLRFQNFALADDFVELPVTLEIGEPKFRPGDKLNGQIGSDNNEDEILFDAIQGLKLKVEVEPRSGDIEPVLTVLTPQGDVESVETFPNKIGKKIKRTIKVKGSGEYRLRIEGADETAGGYTVRTGVKYPKKARKRTVKLKAPGGGTAQEDVLLLPGATLEFAAKPNGDFAGPLTVSFLTPSGASFDISANATLTSDGAMVVEGLELQQTGAFGIQVGGFGGDNDEKVKLHLFPIQPKQGKNKLYLK